MKKQTADEKIMEDLEKLVDMAREAYNKADEEYSALWILYNDAALEGSKNLAKLEQKIQLASDVKDDKRRALRLALAARLSARVLLDSNYQAEMVSLI